jgi:hypothetical protein
MYRRTSLIETSTGADTALADLDVVKDELGITDSSIDPRLTRWIIEASGSIESYVGRFLRARTVIESFEATNDPGHCRHWSGRGTRPLGLSIYPIVSVDLVIRDGITLAPDDYRISPDVGQLLMLSGDTPCSWYGQRIEVTYTGGWVDLTDVPANVAAACTTLVSYRRSSRARDPALRQISVPGVMDRIYYSAPVASGAGASSGLPSEVAASVDYLRDIRM